MKFSTIRLSGYHPARGTYVHIGECGLGVEPYDEMKRLAREYINTRLYTAAQLCFYHGHDCIRYYHVSRYRTILHDFWIEPFFVGVLPSAFPRPGVPEFEQQVRAWRNEQTAREFLKDVRCLEETR